MAELLHLAIPDEYRAAGDTYVPAGYDQDGFVHCCLQSQIKGVLQRWFQAADTLLLLELDAGVFVDTLKYEASPSGQAFPHIYAPIPIKAVMSVRRIVRDERGEWTL